MKRKLEDVERECYEQLLDCIKNNVVELAERLILKLKDSQYIEIDALARLFEATRPKRISPRIRECLLAHILQPMLRDLPLDERHPLWIVVGAGDVATLESMLEQRKFERLDEKFDASWLMFHAYESLKKTPLTCVDVIELLLDNGAAVNVTDEKARNLLHKICFDADWPSELLDFLAQRGITVDQLDENHETPLYQAVSSGHERMVVWLLDHGADPNRATLRNQTTPLIKAARLNEELLVNLLLERGAKVDQLDAGDSSALLAACKHGNNVNVVKLLLKHGAKVDAPNGERRTPFSYAVLSNFKNAMAKVLVAEFAKMKFTASILGKVVELPDLRLVQQISMFKKHYDACTAELEMMNSTSVGSVSVFRAVFMSTSLEFAVLLKNPEIGKLFSVRKMKTVFPLYFFALKTAVDKARAVKEEMLKIDKRVYTNLKCVLPNAEMERVARFLYVEELSGV